MVKVNILWASMFGTAEDVAIDVHEKVKDKGVEIFEMNDVSMEDFQAMENVVFVSSSTGQGDVPTNGENFYSELEKAELDLSKTKYAVCALGDSSHTYFCGAGKKVDERLQQLGAVRVLDRQECDGDDAGSDDWAENFLTRLTNGQ